MKKRSVRILAASAAVGLAIALVPASAHAAEWRSCSASTAVYTTSTPNGGASLTDHTYNAGGSGTPHLYYWTKSWGSSTSSRTSYSGMTSGNVSVYVPSYPPVIGYGCYKYT